MMMMTWMCRLPLDIIPLPIFIQTGL
jgi:hypothetical protein